MYRGKRFIGWVFRKWFKNRGWYRWQNLMISDASNQLYGPYKTRKEALNRNPNPMLLQQVEYHLSTPLASVYHDPRDVK